jgi:N,N'-diacetyllegionaminate synthase
MTKIIAEAGVNHNGSISIAKKLIDAASESGADIVKFQSFNAEELSNSNAPLAEYQRKNKKSYSNQLNMLKELELSLDDAKTLKKYCDKKNIEFLSTAFDPVTLKSLINIGINYIKIPSGEITNFHYLSELEGTEKQILLSTGMSNLDEITKIMEYLRDSLQINNNQITLFQCTSGYPTPIYEVNVEVLTTYKSIFNTKVGLSDHSSSFAPALVAVAKGAEFIEKHFTLDKEMDGPDHKASINIDELASFITLVREASQCIGDGIKSVQASEKSNKLIARRGIYLNRAIKKGEFVNKSDIKFIRPMMNFDPMSYFEILNKKAKIDLKKDQGLRLEDFE